MKTNKLFFTLLLAWILLLTACQPQTDAQPEPPQAAPENPATEAPATAPAESPVSESPQAQSSSLFAKLSELAGLVELKQAGQDSFASASADMQLEVNGQVQTGLDGKARLDLSSGTIIRVAPSSLFTLTSNEETEAGLWTRITLELGKVFVILNGGSAEVETPAGMAAVQGSYLYVEFDGEQLTLTCLEGQCSFVTLSGEKIEFTDGQKVIVRKDPATGGWVVEQQPMTEEDFNNWLANNPEAKDLVEQGLNGGSSGSAEDGEGDCVSIKQPAAGSELPFQGKVKFEWDANPSAAKYLVQFTDVNGNVIMFETANPGFEPYVEGFLPDGGEVSWSITVLDNNGGEVCTTAPLAFTKPASNWIPDASREKGEKFRNDKTPTDGGSGSGGSDGGGGYVYNR